MEQDNVSVAIIGAGFSGLCMGIQLQKAGFKDFTIFEAADDVGGTWRDNTYPGCACDVPSALYCYSFEPYPWTEHYSSQREIFRYQQHCVDKYGLKPHIKLRTRITAAAYDEVTGMWTLTTGDGEQETFRVVVMAQGGLAIPSVPAIPGLDTFKGPAFHSARWNHHVDLTGKRVAVVGTGASAIQIIPSIQPQVQQLHVFQRTPPWVMPRAARFPKWAVRCADTPGWYNWVQRQRWFWLLELIFGKALTRNKRDWLAKFEELPRWHLECQVADPELRKKLTPSYSIGCKRVLASDVYYPALCQPNVQVVTSAVKEVKDGSTIVAADGTEAEVDVIILATGFDLTATLHGMSIKGLAGADLADMLETQPAAFLGLAASDFPNLFTVNGPNTGLGHNSMIFMAECGVNSIVKMLQWMKSKKLKCVEVKQPVQQQFNEEVQERLKGSVWLSGGCSSWYLKQGNEGSQGSSSAVLWPGLCTEYWWRTRQLNKAANWTVQRLQEPPAADKAKLV